jgi:hypothetical protein
MFAIETNNLSEKRSTIATSSVPSETKNVSEKRLRNLLSLRLARHRPQAPLKEVAMRIA